MDNEIKATLIELMNGIKGADAQRLLVLTQRLDEIAARQERSIPPQLLHFLKRRSYGKALQFLSGETDIPAGICGGVRVKTG